LRIIFRVGPAVNNHNVATPVLAMIVFASRMAWLVGPIAGGTTLYLNAVLETKFSKALPGWKWLCRAFGLCERGLFLNSRNKFDAQFLGQPASLMKDTVNLFLNSTRAPNQWVSRRVTLRPYLDLWTVDDMTPGHITAVELASLRQRLEDVEGLAMAQAAGCTVVDKVTADGEVIKLGRLVFNWDVSWQPDSSAAALLQKVDVAGFLKPCWDAISTVKDWPTEVPGRAAGTKPSSRKRGIAAAADGAPVSKRGGGHAAGGSARPRGANPVEAAAAFVAAPPLARVTGCILTVVGKCVAWPQGAWAAEIPLDSFLDLTAVGKVVLEVAVASLPEMSEKDQDQAGGKGTYRYMLTIKQGETMHTPETLALAKFVQAAPGISGSARSVSMLKGIRRVAAKVRAARGTDLGEGTRMGGEVVEMPALPTVLTAVANGGTGGGAVEMPGIRAAAGTTSGLGDSRSILVSQQEEGGVLSAGGGATVGATARRLSGLGSDDPLHTEADVMSDCTRTTLQGQGTVKSAIAIAVEGGLSDNLSTSNDDVVMKVTDAPPPPTSTFSFSWTFCSDLRLRRVPAHVRDAGRLWVVAEAEEVIEKPLLFAHA